MSPLASRRTRPDAAARRGTRPAIALIAVVLLLGLVPAPSTAQAEVPHVLVFSGTYGFRHDSITTGNEAIQELADTTGAFTVEFSELPTSLATDALTGYDLILFNSTTGRIPLSAADRAGLERYWGCGGGFAGVHAAADANYGWPVWAEVVGAQFDAHPHGAGAPPATLQVENADHPVNAGYAGAEGGTLLHADEYYRWMRDVRGTQDTVPLLSLDETSVASGPGSYVDDQPVAWVKTFRDRGRVYYTNLGHNGGTWALEDFRTALVDGISWVGEVRLDEACFTADTPLPPPPAAPQPEPTDPELPPVPREACVPAAGQQVVRPGQTLTYEPSHAATPLYFSKDRDEVVLDLSGTTAERVDLTVTHTWPSPLDDYDLAISTPWGFAGSDAAQPVAAATEQALVPGVTHCATLGIAVFNHLATTGALAGAGTVTVQVGGATPPPPPAPPAPPELPPLPELPVPAGAPGVVVAPPSAQATGFMPPVVVTTQGAGASLVGLDVERHNIVCTGRTAEGKVPCRSAEVTLGTVVPIAGVESLPAGSWPFICGLHPAMAGEFLIQ